MPPDIPNYSSRPLRPYQDVFLYLNERHLSNGPLLVYSNPRDYGPGPNQARSKYHAPYQAPSTLDQPLRVVFLRFWHRVADELHTLWSLCSPRLPLSAADTPTITLRIHVPDTLSPGTRQVNGLHNFGRGPPYDCTFSLRSTFHEPITIHKHPLFSHDLWWEALDLVHLATGEVVPEAASIYPSPGQDVADSWQQSRELGFARDHSPEPRHMQTLHPGQWTEVLDTEGRRIRHDMDMWLIERHEAGLLRRGPGRYALRLRKGVVVPRWTSGAVDERRGPYNLPPLALELEGGPEGGVQFDFLG